MVFTLRPYQREARDAAIAALDRFRSTLLVLPTGCHRAGQLVMMSTGEIRRVEDVELGDKVMGPDGPREVLALARGEGAMVEIRPAAGEPWVVNDEHWLTLCDAPRGRGRSATCYEVMARDWLEWHPSRQAESRLVRIGVEPADVLTKYGRAQAVRFTAERTGTIEPYFGFALSGDQRYVLADHTITHNTGKTVTFSQVATFAAEQGLRVLVLAHRRELLKQAKRTFERCGLECDLEVAELRAPTQSSRHVIGSVQSMQRKRLARFAPNAFGLIIVDEAHHACAKTYRNVLAHFPHARVLGVTATPDRGDKVEMKTVFDEVAYSYEIKTAIRDGYLVPIRSRRIVVEGLDLKSVKLKGRSRHSAFDEKELSKLLQRDESLHGMAEPIVREAGARSTLIFCANVAHAHAMAEVINRYAGEGMAQALDGSASDEERAEVIARFRAGELQFLCNCMLFLEGFDAPITSCVAMARPWKVRAPYVQAVGRGTRLHPESGKRDLLVLDFVGNSDDHSLICPADILEGKKLEEGERKAVAKVLQDDPDLDVVEALSAAEEQLLASVTVSVRYRAFDSDPFTALGLTRPREDPEWSRPATPAQLRTRSLQSLGDAAKDLTRREASELIDALSGRAAEGLATYRQMRTLARYGFDPSGIARDEAGRLITAIAKNGWRRPDDLVAERVPVTEVTKPEEPVSGQRRTRV